MHQDVIVVTSADDNFAVGLAGTFPSALHHLGSGRRLRLFVLDGGIRNENKAALQRHWGTDRMQVEWVQVDRRLVREFVVSEHISEATYYRLLSPAVLPANIERFIYHDADMLVRRDLGEFWDLPAAGQPSIAVQDPAAPYLDCAVALQDRKAVLGHLASTCPIRNYRELGLDPRAPYFNGGLMMIDLVAWRREKLAEQMLRVLTQHREHVLWWDQYALNVVLSGRWQPADARWNQNSFILRQQSAAETIFSPREFQQYVTDPWIVHFNGVKPWQPDCTHPRAAEFLQFLRGSPWEREFRPAALPATISPPQRSRYRVARDFVKTRLRRARHAVRSLFGRRAA